MSTGSRRFAREDATTSKDRLKARDLPPKIDDNLVSARKYRLVEISLF